MRTEAHISVTRADIRGGQLSRHAARRLQGGRAFAVSTGLGLPRTWSLATQSALDGFEAHLSDDDESDGQARLGDAVAAARDALADRCDQLVERLLPDATLVGLLLSAGQLHVISVGPGRVYVQRNGQPKRLTAREDEDKSGLLRARPSVCSTEVHPGDLILAGSLTAFSMSSIAKAMSVLGADPQTQPSVLASLLTEPAAKAGVGAAAIVVRIR
ncbi:MAG: PP2C family serine/threonine-protein phosphatase [Sandaracinaceae bacterium]|nr:MAG: protein phosphatase 2C family protein [Sandaracinaceae bacterium]